jgi:hypothetical protein
VLDNDTGHAIRTFGCLSMFQVALISGSYRQTVAWAACLQRFTIPAGLARYRVTVLASYSQCSPARPRHGLRACLPGERMPPLPPGTYHAGLFQARLLVRVPPAITVRVTPAHLGSAAAGPRLKITIRDGSRPRPPRANPTILSAARRTG